MVNLQVVRLEQGDKWEYKPMMVGFVTALVFARA